MKRLFYRFWMFILKRMPFNYQLRLWANRIDNSDEPFDVKYSYLELLMVNMKLSDDFEKINSISKIEK